MPASTTTSNNQRPTTGRAPASDRLWAALRAYPGSSTEQLAAHASVGQSTAGKILARWVADSTVARHAATGDKGRGPATYTIAERTGPAPDHDGDGATDVVADTDTDDSGSEATPASDAPVSDDTPPVADIATAQPVTTAPSEAKAPRLAPGGLRGMVEDYLREHPSDDLGPAGIGKELGRSSGAVANALDRLVADGYAVMTSAKPKRYRFAGSPAGD